MSIKFERAQAPFSEILQKVEELGLQNISSQFDYGCCVVQEGKFCSLKPGSSLWERVENKISEKEFLQMQK